MKRTLALILSLVMCLGLLAGCGDKKTDDGQTDGKTLVVGTQNFDGKFSPFFYTNDYENQVMGMVFDGLFLVDREGSVVLKGIEGDVRPYNGTDYTYKGIADCDIVENSDGTVDYNITLKEGVKFSDGEEMTIDDVIFSYYVLLDPAYDGVSTLYSLPIKGLEAYRSGMDTVQNLILAAGPDAYAANDFYTEEQYNAYWAAFNAAGVKFAQEILDYVVAAGYATADDSVAAQAVNWGFELADDATVEDFWLPSLLSTATTSPMTVSTPRPPAPASPPSSRPSWATPTTTIPSPSRPASPLPTLPVSSRPVTTP